MAIPGGLRTRSERRATLLPHIRYHEQIALIDLLLPLFRGDLESL